MTSLQIILDKERKTVSAIVHNTINSNDIERIWSWNKRHLDTHRWMQCDDSKHEHKYQSHHNEECVKPTIMSWWGKKIKENPRKWKGCHVAYKGNNKQSHVPTISERKRLFFYDQRKYLFPLKTTVSNQLQKMDGYQNCSSYPTHLSFHPWTKSSKSTTWTRRNNPEPNFEVASAFRNTNISSSQWKKHKWLKWYCNCQICSL